MNLSEERWLFDPAPAEDLLGKDVEAVKSRMQELEEQRKKIEEQEKDQKEKQQNIVLTDNLYKGSINLTRGIRDPKNYTVDKITDLRLTYNGLERLLSMVDGYKDVKDQVRRRLNWYKGVERDVISILKKTQPEQIEAYLKDVNGLWG